jgi:integrase
LAKQAVAILRELRPLTGLCPYVFPSQRSRDRPMSDAAVNAALRRLDIAKETASGHGFRATARTLLDETLGFRVDLIEAQLAHAVRDPNGRAYNRTAFLPERKAMMQKWADYLGELAAGGSSQQIEGAVI